MAFDYQASKNRARTFLDSALLERATQPTPLELADAGANLRGILLDNLLQQQAASALPAIDVNTASIPQAQAAQSEIDRQFDPLIKEAGSVSEPPEPGVGQKILGGLSQAASTFFARDPAAALQNQLLNQKIEAQNKPAGADKAKERALDIKFKVAGKKLDIAEKEKDRLVKQDDDVRRYLLEFTGKESLEGLKFSHEKKLFELKSGDEWNRLANNQEFTQALAVAARGDKREGDRIKTEFKMMKYLPKVDPAEIKGASRRLHFSDIYGNATARDGELINQAHASEQRQKEKISGRDAGLDDAKFEGQLFTKTLLDNTSKPVLKADGTISIDPFSGRPNMLPISSEEAYQNAVNIVTAWRSYRAGTGFPAKAVPPPKAAPVATLSPAQKATEIAAVDPDAALRSQGAAMADDLLSKGMTAQQIISLLATTTAPQASKDGLLARLTELGRGNK